MQPAPENVRSLTPAEYEELRRLLEAIRPRPLPKWYPATPFLSPGLLCLFMVENKWPPHIQIGQAIAISLVSYGVAMTLMLCARRADWDVEVSATSPGVRRRLKELTTGIAEPRLEQRLGGRLVPTDSWTGIVVHAKFWWTAAWLGYLIHVALAFDYVHNWSHAHAFEHTREVGGVGEGIYVNYLFTLLWTADVLWWWLAPAAYAGRSPWLDRLLHGFMLFVIFNATVVFASGFSRWGGVALLVWLALLAAWRRRGYLSVR